MVIFINNNAFAYSFTGNIEFSGTEFSIVKHGNVGNKSSNNKRKSTTYFYNNNNNDNNNPLDLLESVVNINFDKLVNIKNLTVNINFLNCYFDDDG